MQRTMRHAKCALSLSSQYSRALATNAADIGEIGVICGAPDSTFKRKVPPVQPTGFFIEP